MTTEQAAPSWALNEEQQAAYEQIMKWVADSHSHHFFLLRGYAGTGKTFTMKAVLQGVRGRVCFTAPTNKAAKVLRETLTTKDYKPECRTIYSLLGLRMEANGEVKELAVPEEEIDLSSYRLIVVDEGSMLNAQVMGHVREAAQLFNLKFLFMGDDAQLPPVKETKSPVFDPEVVPNVAALTKVMRHDNAILTLATALRQEVYKIAPKVAMRTNYDLDKMEGVKVMAGEAFAALIGDAAITGDFHEGRAKVIAWRNVTVDKWNRFIRQQVYGPSAAAPWHVGERVIFTSPAKDLQDEPMASTDDEGLISKVTEDWHPAWTEFKCYRISITLDDNRLATAWVLHPEALGAWNRKSEGLAEAARADRRKWKAFWEFKEAFHQLRHAYAITAHRSQGSTYQTVFGEYRDVLLNQNRQEAFRCLYVLCTRPSKELFLS